MTSSGSPEQNGAIGARVPDHVSAGVFASGVIVVNGPGEFVLDFVQTVIRPPRLIKRMVLIPPVMGQFIEAFGENLRRFEQSFGPPKPLPNPHMPRTEPCAGPAWPGVVAPVESAGQSPAGSSGGRPSLQELYDELKMADADLTGVYANAVLISHSPAEFVFDFVTRFVPRSVVAARIYLAASHAPQVLDSMTAAYQHYQQSQ